MKKTKLILLVCSLLFVGEMFCQLKKEQKSKMQNFVSKKGVIIKFQDYNLPKIKSSYGNADSRIRKITSGNITEYFFQISKKGKYDTKTASIAYLDLLEIQKASKTLKQQSEKDISTSSDYLENKFITDDEFKVGYYIDKGKITWYIKLDNYGSNNTLFIKNFESILSAFKLGVEKINELKIK